MPNTAKLVLAVILALLVAALAGCGGSPAELAPPPTGVRGADNGWKIQVNRLEYWGDKPVPQEDYKVDGTHVPTTEYFSFAAVAPMSPQASKGGMNQETYEVKLGGMVIPPTDKNGWKRQPGTYQVRATFQQDPGGSVFHPWETIVVEPLEGRWGFSFGINGSQPWVTWDGHDLHTVIGGEFDIVTWKSRNDSSPGEIPGAFYTTSLGPTAGANLLEKTAWGWTPIATGVVTFEGTTTWTNGNRTLTFDVTHKVYITAGAG